MAEGSSWQTQERIEPAMADMLMAGDDRRMQVRAFKFWSSLLHGQDFPRVADLPLDALPDFGPWSILIDLRGPHPLIRFLGEELRIEAGLAEHVVSLAQVPPRSLISRLTDRCAELVTCQSGLGFEAEFLSHKGQETLYRGLLLPFSSDGVEVDYAYGVISWKARAEPIMRQVRPGGAVPVCCAQSLSRACGAMPRQQTGSAKHASAAKPILQGFSVVRRSRG